MIIGFKAIGVFVFHKGRWMSFALSPYALPVVFVAFTMMLALSKPVTCVSADQGPSSRPSVGLPMPSMYAPPIAFASFHDGITQRWMFGTMVLVPLMVLVSVMFPLFTVVMLMVAMVMFAVDVAMPRLVNVMPRFRAHH